jgi:hypothetical protein
MALSPKIFLSELVKEKLITQAQADTYELEALQKNLPIDEYLSRESLIDRDLILKIKATMLKVPFVNISTTAIDPQAISLVPEQVARRFTILPYIYDSKQDAVLVATADPLNINLADFLEKKTAKRILFSLANAEDITKMINLSYTQGLSPEVKEALEEVGP